MKKIILLLSLLVIGMFLVGCTQEPAVDPQSVEDVTEADLAELPEDLQPLEVEEPALAGQASRWYDCQDSDSTSTYDKNSLLTKSTTTFTGGSKTDRCYTWYEGTPQEKTRLIEGICRITRSGSKFSYWYADCSQKLGDGFECVDGACVEEEEEGIIFADSNLEIAIREKINKPEGPIYEDDLVDLTDLIAKNKEIIDLSGIEHLTNLKSLQIGNNLSISSLAGLTSLTYLSIPENQINDISALTNLINLKSLSFASNQVSDISALAGLTKLTTLYVGVNQVSDLSALSDLISLNKLYIYGNQINDISALSDLTNLEVLIISKNQINDISALSNLVNLKELTLEKNNIDDISGLSGLTSLTKLNLATNQIEDISALSDLTSLITLYLGSNQINGISALSNLKSLELLSLGDNKISDISALSDLTSLKSLDLYHNEISEIGALSDLISLTTLNLNLNSISDEDEACCVIFSIGDQLTDLKGLDCSEFSAESC